MNLCERCLKHYKHSPSGREARAIGGAWGRGKWPAFVYHDGPGRLCEKHSAQRRADDAKRRADEIRATPPWADLQAIKAVYEGTRVKEIETGRAFHVDHIVPLRGSRVNGLHVAYNLRAIPAGENMKKGKRFEI